MTTMKSKKRLLLVWVHGFKGNDQTFESFPDRIKYMLDGSDSNLILTNHVYPAYKTQGKLEDCVDDFLNWVTTLVAEAEMEIQDSSQESKNFANVVLIGHSMGGLVVTDAFRKLVGGYDKADAIGSVWPKVIGILAFDTPFLGVHPASFANTAQQYIDFTSKAHSALSSVGLGIGALGATQKSKSSAPSSGGGWNKWGLAAAGLGALATAAGGLAYMQQQSQFDLFSNTQSWVSSHLEFVGALWNQQELDSRLNEVKELCGKTGTGFHCFYTLLGGSSTSNQQDSPDRTFIILPGPTKPLQDKFTPNTNIRANNEVDAHTCMFSERGNDGSYTLGIESVKLISSWI